MLQNLPFLLLAFGAAAAFILALIRTLQASHRPASDIRLFVLWTMLLGVSSVCLAFFLYPPDQQSDGQLLVVGSARASQSIAAQSSRAPRVDLPESDSGAAPTQVPDLATALRRFPATRRLLVLGAGLTPRDLDAARPLRVDFSPAAEPTGLIELDAPPSAIAGSLWRLRGRILAAPDSRILLLDPAGHTVARTRSGRGGVFALAAVPTVAGTARYRLRLTDAAGAQLGQDEVLPLIVHPGEHMRVALLAGAPSPEIKYLRRWARDAGVVIEADIAVGASSRVGQPAAPIWRAREDVVAPVDLVVIDDRRWRTLGSEQEESLRAAVRDGAGLLLRMTGPFGEQDRPRLQLLGFELDSIQSLTGPSASGPDSGLLKGLRPRSADERALRDPVGGRPGGLMRMEGRGRIGVWWGQESYPRVLEGRSTAHGLLWSSLFEQLGRASTKAPAPVWNAGAMRVHERQNVCADLPDVPRVTSPGNRAITLLPVSVDAPGVARGQRCAAFWPREKGWHRLHWGRSDTAFFVHGAEAFKVMAEMSNRQATLRLATRPNTRIVASAPPMRSAGSRWPWFLAWLASAAAMWWLERRRSMLRHAAVREAISRH